MNVQFLGHSTVKVQGDYCSVLVDPFFRGNPMACNTADDYISLDGLLLTRLLDERLQDTLEIATKTECPVLCDAPTAQKLQAAGLSSSQIIVMTPGESKNFDFGRVEMVEADPGVSYIVEVEKHRVWVSGESRYCESWSGLKEKAIDLAFVAIGGGEMMSAEEGAKAVEAIRPREAVPMAYGTFSHLTPDATAFAKAAGSHTNVVILQSSEKENL